MFTPRMEVHALNLKCVREMVGGVEELMGELIRRGEAAASVGERDQCAKFVLQAREITHISALGATNAQRCGPRGPH